MATKSTGAIIRGGNPPSRVASATMFRAKGNNKRGHSISNIACKCSDGTLILKSPPYVNSVIKAVSLATLQLACISI